MNSSIASAVLGLLAPSCTYAFISPSTAKTFTSQSKALNANLFTFDLDDTLFPVGPVVNDANVALINHLATLGCKTTQDDFLKTTKSIRRGLADEGKVITYTELRQRTIRKEMEKYLNHDDITDEEVYGAYDLWEDHRHMAAERHLYHDTIEMLSGLKENYPDAVLAAITNGKGNPLKMKCIESYFDYCVSGEDDDVFPLRKPHEGIYKVALDRYQVIDGVLSIDHENFCWIHVGDDLANDVGASARCGAKSIWVDLEEDTYNQTASKREPGAAQPAWSTATKEELEKREKMNQDAQKYVAARVSTLSMLPNAVQQIAAEAISTKE